MTSMAIGAIGSSSSYGIEPHRRQAQLAGQPELTPEQQQQVNRLRAIDQKVRAHEAAHQAAGAGLTGGASLQFARGPDGKQYAVAGEVKIDASPAQTPEQTLVKAERIQAAALAPADPSAQDRAVAAQAAQMAMQARQELQRIKSEGNQESVIREAIAAYTDSSPRPASRVSLFA